MYEEWASRLGAGTVVWSRVAPTTAPSAPPSPVRVLPDGCMDLIWHDGLLVAGPDTVAQLGAADASGGRWTGLRFAPGVGPAVFGVPANELRDRRLPLDALWPGDRVRRLTERVAEADDRAGVLEAIAAVRAPEPDPLCRAVAAGLRRGRPVGALAAEAGISARQLQRRAHAAFGYGPKTLARILRMERALLRAREGMPPAAVAAVAGYADQAHLSREVRALAGVPLGALLAPDGG